MSVTNQIDQAHTGRFDHIRCGACGVPWNEHTAECSRHAFRSVENAPEKIRAGDRGIMNIASREHAVALGLAHVWDREMSGRGQIPEFRNTGIPEYRNFERRGPAGGRRPTAKNELGQNKTEARYDVHLSEMAQQGRIIDHAFEPFKWKLADKTWFRIDFAVWVPGGLVAVDVKGWLEDDASVKAKWFADKYKRVPLYLASYQRGAWTYRVCGRGGIVASVAPF